MIWNILESYEIKFYEIFVRLLVHDVNTFQQKTRENSSRTNGVIHTKKIYLNMNVIYPFSETNDWEKPIGKCGIANAGKCNIFLRNVTIWPKDEICEYVDEKKTILRCVCVKIVLHIFRKCLNCRNVI